MAINRERRQLLSALPGAAALALLPDLGWAASAPDTLACWSDNAQRPQFFYAGLSNAPRHALALAARGHDVKWHPHDKGSAFVAARRPGSFLIHWRVADGKVLARFDAEDDLRFEGHIAFDAAGRRLFASESNLLTGAGQIGVFAAETLERIDTWPTQGIGPHEILLLRNGSLAVANGGILTLPETGRVKRNLNSMDPALVMLDSKDGTLLEQFRLADSFMSIRHLAQTQDGEIGVALQNESNELRPLFAYLDGSHLRYGDANAAVLEACGTYSGDIAVSGEYFAVSCTTAGVTAIWNTRGQPIAQLGTPRVCALTALNGEWLASADTGARWRLDLNAAHTLSAPRETRAWDNHAVLKS